MNPELENYTVECYYCSSFFRNIGGSDDKKKPEQGNGCASWPTKLATGEIVVCAGYGSMYDTDCFLVVDSESAESLSLSIKYRNEDWSACSICDECLARRVAEKKFLPIESKGIDGPNIPPKPLSHAWPQWAYIPVNTDNSDLLYQANRKIEDLEYKLSQMKSASAYAALQHRYDKLLKDITKYMADKGETGDLVWLMRSGGPEN